MAAPGGGRDHASNDPTGNFGSAGSSQFASYPYPTIDTELSNIPPSYNMPPYSRQLEDAADSVDKMDQGNMSNMSIDPNGAAAASVVDPAMAPPQTPNQGSFMSGAGRQSLDASGDTPQDPQTGDKRKRSKASRACDECRRKKVKCDAPVDIDGSPRTCANCQKAQVNCEFERKPMKRGPSKGYISALAERVQGLEQKQRQSFDAGTGPFAESFSPDQETGPGFNRAPSFSASTSAPVNFNPFPRSEYSRDRIPSVGWGAYSTTSIVRPRASGSLAIAPNETFPSSIQNDPNLKVQIRDNSKSLLGEIFHSRPAKRQRTLGPEDNMHPPPTIDEAFMAKYYEQYHEQLALLPALDKILAVVKAADVGIQHAFATVIELLADLRPQPVVNGNHDTEMNLDPAINLPRKTLISPQFQTYDGLQDYVFGQAVGSTSGQLTEEENLSLVWILTLLAMSCENDMIHVRDNGTRAKSNFLYYGRIVLNRVEGGNNNPGRRTQYPDEVKQAFNCLSALAKYHAMGHALPVSTFIPPPALHHVECDAKALPFNSTYFVSSSNLLTLLSQVMLPNADNNSQLRSVLAGCLEDHFQLHFSLFEGSMSDATIPKQVHCLIKLFLASVTPYFVEGLETHAYHVSVMNTLQWTDGLTTILIQDAQAHAAAPRYNPLDMHTWSVAAIMLALFVVDVSDKALADFAAKRLEALRVELEKKAAAFHKNHGLEWFYGGAMEHWADVLLAMVEATRSRPAAAEEAVVGVGGGAGDTVLVPKFSEVVEKGWMGVALYFKKE